MTLVYHFRGINLSHLSSWPVLYVSLAYRSVSLGFPALLDPSCASIFPISLRIRVEKCNAARLRWIEGVESLAEDLAIKKSSIGSRRMGKEERERERGKRVEKVCERDAAGHEAANHSAAIANKKIFNIRSSSRIQDLKCITCTRRIFPLFSP